MNISVYPVFIQSLHIADGSRRLRIDAQQYPQGIIGNGPAFFSRFDSFPWENITDQDYYGLRYHKYFDNFTLQTEYNSTRNLPYGPNSDEHHRLVALLDTVYRDRTTYQSMIARNEHISHLTNFTMTSKLKLELQHMDLGHSTDCSSSLTPGETDTRLGIFVSHHQPFQYCRNAHQLTEKTAAYDLHPESSMFVLFWQDFFLKNHQGFILKYQIGQFVSYVSI